MKRSGGRRYYRREDVLLLRGIRHLLYGEGYTIRGVQRILREQGIKAVQGFDGFAAQPGPQEEIDETALEDRDTEAAQAEPDAFHNGIEDESDGHEDRPVLQD